MTQYVGRFAPTPSGPLHFGSLFAAVVSYLDAKVHQGRWQVRIEDIDPPREQAGAADAILKTLEGFGLQWDGPVTYQSKNAQRYENYLQILADQGRLFWCDCSRKKLTGNNTYPGFCRHHQSPRPNSAIRLLSTTHYDSFRDTFQGEQSADVSKEYGDVVLKRRDQLYAYQLAVVADDIAENVTQIIRGIDLMSSTYWQRELYTAFGQQPPTYGHFAVIHEAGSTQKLSKQNLAQPIDAGHAVTQLQEVFSLIGLNIESDTPERMLAQAASQYSRTKLNNKQILHRSENQLD